MARGHDGCKRSRLAVGGSDAVDDAHHAAATHRSDTPRDVDDETFAPEHAHLPLVWMTVLAQLAAGATVCAAITGSTRIAATATLAWLAALTGSLLHLGRPTRAWKAIRNVRSSWLSREIVAFSAAIPCTALLALHPTAVTGLVAALVNIAAIVVNAQVYRLAPRPAWDTPLTTVRFLASAARLGPLVAAAMTHHHPSRGRSSASSALSTMLIAEGANSCGSSAAADRAARATVWLWSTRFARVRTIRSAIMLPAIGAGIVSPWLGLAFALVSEALGRWLFFVTVAGTTPAGRWNAAWR